MAWCFLSLPVSAQVSALDSVWVERFHQVIVGPDTLNTYRIYVRIAPDHRMQMVYGAERHPLQISASAPFHNQIDRPWSFAHEVEADQGIDANGIPDSWVTIGAADAAHWAIPLHLDAKGSHYAKHGRCSGPRSRRPSWCVRDGSIDADSVPQVVTFRFTPSYLAAVKGSELHTLDGAWAVLGGVSGARTEGHVLLAQLTTSGTLSFQFNLQIGLPDGSFQRFVYADPEPGEIIHPSLRQTVTWPSDN